MSLALIIALIYGILAMVGGVVGYLKARSLPSLISGIVSGLLLLIGALRAAQGIASGLWVVKIVTLVLVVVFIIRLVKTKKFMPAGLMVIGGIATLIGVLV
ncbi:TMEM14 family protein [Leptothoe sp. PORK10 BA2]|uniref:TMEM14 family protein n=1 Tax=Leptothoe sp. PORK10 BA2 TaxID=3110254 RepID=UPI002B2064A2|nr:TMEM14 family protein [Leptothoe sp. PORK10 BA2]MEA5462715.1 TMEM14 family protein [Leptothoe sp. PORK10 BA2]